MAVTGSLSSSKFTKGPGLIFFDCVIPTTGSSVALVSGEPAAGLKMGYTPAGNTIAIGYDSQDVNVDEALAPIETIMQNEQLSIAGSAMQIEDMKVMEKLLPQGTLVPGPPEIMQFGGKVALTVTACMVLVWRAKADPAKYVEFALYNPMNTAGSGWQVTKTGYGEASYTFLGRAVSGRAAPDQIGFFAASVTST